MDLWLKSCTAPPAKARPDSAPGTPTLDPAYLNGLPSVEKVVRDIHGATPAEAAARQIAILEYLPYIIINMQTVPSRPRARLAPRSRRASISRSVRTRP
jgi:hypothetical protein